jgi:hypothetical protein
VENGGREENTSTDTEFSALRTYRGESDEKVLI